MLVLLCSVGVTEEKKLVQRLNYGVVFREDSHLILSNEYWFHTYEITIPEYVAIPNIGTCHKDNSTCLLIAHVLTSINTVRSETAARLNSTVETIKKLVPKLEVQKSRSRRSLLPFIGQFTKSLFGTATVDDVNILAKHMNAITKRTRQMASLLAQHEDDLSSFVTTANHRMDNLMKGIKENDMAINYVQTQLQRTTKNLQHMFEQMINLLSQQIKTSSIMNHELDELKIGVTDLVNGKLSPLILPQSVLKSTLRDIQNILITRYPGFYLTQPSPAHIYSNVNFMYARNGTSLFITVKLPISHFKDPLLVYNVISLPVPVNSTSAHATHLLDLPENLILTSDHQFYTTFTNTELGKCKGKSLKHCSFNVPLTPITTESCILALYVNSKKKVKTMCDFRFLHDAVKSSIIELNPYSLALYRTPLLSMECGKKHKMIKGCDFCIIKLPCQCSVITSDFYLAPRLTSCHNHTKHVTKVHPVNLILLQHFFTNKYTDNIFADTTFTNPVNMTVPNFKLYKHNMKDILADDNKAHLSLSKMAESAKKDATIFQSLAESMLDGEVTIESNWPDLNAILILVTMGTTVLSSLLLFWTFFKLRKMATAITVLQQCQRIESLPTTVPSFIYKSNQPVNSSEVFNLDLTVLKWDQAIFAVVFVMCCLLIYLLFRIRSKNETPKICVEVTNTQQCVLIEIASLPLCPSQCTIQPPTSIVDIDVGGSFCKPFLSAQWKDFSVTENITQKVIPLPEVLSISFVEFWKLRSIIQRPFFVYLYVQHHNKLEKLN